MANSKQVLIIDDDDALRSSLAEQLELHEGYETYRPRTAPGRSNW